MNLFDNLLKKDKPNPSSGQNPGTPSPFIVKPRGKEVGANLEEQRTKVKLFGNYKSFTFNLNVYGKSIFHNLILSVSATAVNSEEMIPVKCKWKRINANTDIFIKGISSFSYMPTAEDIGFTIEVEVTPLENPGETAIGQYGPIEMDKDMKDTVELLLTNGQTHFTVNVYDTVNQERMANKEIIIHLNSDELKLVEVDFQNKETILEQCKYIPLNPVIKINPCDSTRFIMKFFTFDLDDSGSSKVKSQLKREYNLIALSKQCRELIYLIIQFFIIDEKLKNNKLFSLVNYKSLPSDTKVNVTEVMGELKTLKEENNIMIRNIKHLEIVNRKINEDYKNLEEDFQVTLQGINGADMQVREEIENNMQKGLMNSQVALAQGGNWKKKHDELLQLHTSLTAKEKALREEIAGFLLNEEINKNLLNKKESDIKELKKCISQLTGEISSLNQSNAILNEKSNKAQSENQKLLSDIQALKGELDFIKGGKDQLSVLSSEVEALKKEKEAVKYDNQNLIVQRNLLTKQKNDLAKTFEEMKSKKEAAEKALMKRNEEYEALQLSLSEKDKERAAAQSELEKARKGVKDLQLKCKELQNEYNALKEEYCSMSKPLDTSQMSIVSSRDQYVRIQKDEYEEFDQFKRGQDETEAMILQLKAHNEAQALEIKKLKLLLENKDTK